MNTQRSIALVLGLVGVLAGPGCGDDDGGSDAGIGTDGAAGDGAAGDGGGGNAATVEVVDDFGAAIADVDVVFHAADGSVAAATKTDADGRASFAVASGAMVTVAMTIGGRHELYTFTGVQPGDHLTKLVFAPPPDGPPPGPDEDGGMPDADGGGPTPVATATITLPGAFGGADGGYVIDFGCTAQFVEEASRPVEVGLPEECFADGDSVNLLVLATDGTGATLAYILTRDIALADVGTIVLADWSTAFHSLPLSLSNSEPAIGRMWTLFAFSSLGSLPFAPPPGFAPITMATAEMAIDFPMGFEAGDMGYMTTITEINDDPAAPVRLQARFVNAMTMPASLDLDLATDFLPAMEPPVLDESGVAPTVSWTEDTAAVDIVMVSVSWGDAGGEPTHSWLVSTAPGSSAVALPQLPEALAAFAPPAALGAAAGYSGQIVVLESPDFTWDDLRVASEPFVDGPDTYARIGGFATFDNAI